MDVKHVQAELPLPLYEALARSAKRQGRTIKAVTEDAIAAYVQADTEPENDPLWRFVGSGDLPAGNYSEQKDWRFRRPKK